MTNKIKIIVLLVILFIFSSTLLNIFEFKSNYLLFQDLIKQLFPQISSSIYHGTNLDAYLDTLKESIINLMLSFVNLRSVGSAITCIIIGIILLVEPIKENIEDFLKSFFDYKFL